jgi:hypothetical protein
MPSIRALTSSLLFPAVIVLSGCKLLPVNEEVDARPSTCVSDQNSARQQRFGLDTELEARVTATLLGTVALGDAAKKLDEQVAELCIGISRDLGTKEPQLAPEAELGKRSQIACDAAIDLIRTEKQKGEVNLSVDMKEQTCSALLEDFGTCARDCDPNVAGTPGGGVSCEEGKLSGRCAAQCTGTCIDNFTDSCKSTCQGKCAGKCMQGFFGKCGGKCIGTCDMANVNGKCEGNCDGKCLSDALGTCEGTCEGKCQGACLTEIKKRSCGGTCSGTCSEKMSLGRCDDVVVPPELNPECSAMCAARTSSNLACSGGYVEVAVFSAKDKVQGERIKSAVGGRLKQILGIGDGMHPVLEKAAERVKDAIAGIGQAAQENPALEQKTGECLKQAQQKQEAASAAFAKLHELGQALYQAVRN